MIKKVFFILLVTAFFIFSFAVISNAVNYTYIEENNGNKQEKLQDNLQNDGLPILNITLNGTTLSQINSRSKEIKYEGNTVELTNAQEDKYNFIDTNVQIKGRGNFTWRSLDKKGYQLKFSSKTNVLGMGKAKKWILIANHADLSLMRNKLVFDLADEMGLNYTSKAKYIDLYVDGEYQGNYIICEKVEIGTNRVELKDEKGILVELDNINYDAEDTHFRTDISKTILVLHDSVADDEDEENSVSKQAMNEFKTYVNNFEQVLYSDNKDYEEISNYIDIDSFIKCYFIQELTEDPDGGRSSFFMYKDGDEDVIHCGPVWDFDIALGNYEVTAFGGNTEGDYAINIKKYRESSNDWFAQLFKVQEIRERMLEIYQDEIKPVFETTNDKISAYQVEINDSAIHNFQKWNILGKTSVLGRDAHETKGSHLEEVEYLNRWVQKRVDYLNRRYNSESLITNVQYSTYIKGNGWKDDSFNGETSGVINQNKCIEAIKINLESFNQIVNDTSISYKVHMSDKGWMDWMSDGQTAGLIGKNKRIEAIQIKSNNSDYIVKYRVYVKSLGWMNWVTDEEVAGTTGRCLPIEAIEIKLLDKNQILPSIQYNTHIQDYGWENNFSKNNGMISGTTGQNKKIEAIKIKLANVSNASIEYQSYLTGIGWQNAVKNGEISGTTGQNRKMEAIKISLKGLDNYSICYRVHMENIGWMDWKNNGEIAGRIGYGGKIEAIQIRIVKKDQVSVVYNSHVQDYGWEDEFIKADGEITGTTGQNKKVEAIKIDLINAPENAKIKYQTYVEGKGWQSEVSNGEITGTTGQNRKIYGIKMSLENMTNYKIQYRVHVENVGWMNWVCDGNVAGRVDNNLKIEAIQIKIVEN